MDIAEKEARDMTRQKQEQLQNGKHAYSKELERASSHACRQSCCCPRLNGDKGADVFPTLRCRTQSMRTASQPQSASVANMPHVKVGGTHKIVGFRWVSHCRANWLKKILKNPTHQLTT